MKRYETWSDYEIEDVPYCSFCGNDSRTLIASAWRYGLVRCNGCGFFYTSPRLNEEALLKHYDENLRLGADVARRKIRNVSPNVKVARNLLAESNSDELRRYWKWMQDHFEFITKHKNIGKLLDVGFGDGTRLKIAWQNGWEDLYGIEVADAGVEKVKEKVPIDNAEQRFRKSTLLDKIFQPGMFDVVTFYGVLEHLQDPLDNLLETNRILKIGGVIIIVVPNFRRQLVDAYLGRVLVYLLSPILRIIGKKPTINMSFRDVFSLRKDVSGPLSGVPFAADLHLNHFTDDILTMFLKKSGFKVVENGCDYKDLPGSIWSANLIKRFTDSVTKPLYLITLKRKFNFAPELKFAARKIRDV